MSEKAFHIGSLKVEIHIDKVTRDFQPCYNFFNGEHVVIKRNKDGDKEIRIISSQHKIKSKKGTEKRG